MTLFQWLTIPALGLLLLIEVVGWLRRGAASWVGVLRGAIWVGAATAIGFPDLTTDVAHYLGISRGADLIFYAFVLAFLAVSFYFYARHVRTERQITELVRQIAIERARKGPAKP
jgi:hypothetical protein